MRKARMVCVESATVALAGLLVALAANAISPRGLKLSRNYFPDIRANTNATASVNPAAGTNSAAVVRLLQRGLQLVSSSETFELFNDPRYSQGLIVFVDARNDEHYAESHIPGAWQLDHYRPESYMPVVLPACLGAMKVVVYCNGGQCDDSEFTAVMLREAGVPAQSVFVYADGITDWTVQGRPLESGVRGSGQIPTAKAKP